MATPYTPLAIRAAGERRRVELVQKEDKENLMDNEDNRKRVVKDYGIGFTWLSTSLVISQRDRNRNSNLIPAPTTSLKCVSVAEAP